MIAKSLTEPQFSQLFDTFGESAFRLETLQKYNVEYENLWLRDFAQGMPHYTHPDHKEWLDYLSCVVSSGKSISRVHVVTLPLSQYVRFEMSWPYADNVLAGERIGVIAVEKSDWPEELAHNDFWIFDSKRVATMNYSPDGSFDFAALVEDENEVQRYLARHRAALQLATPYEDVKLDFLK